MYITYNMYIYVRDISSHAAGFQKFTLEKWGPAPGRFELSKGILK